MADCVVKQEYGTSIPEKRSVGVKICNSLLEKIRFDFQIARTDNQADMRYMINMDYSNDLPINSMGRRVRTRLYFTSESHLYTLLNVLRFAGDGKTVLSEPGLSFINQTPELCYLTQVVFRLFEDTSLPMEEARRFRVEILFSPGATAPPLLLDEDDKSYDETRLNTAELVRVERDGLTCEEIEDFFGAVISENGQPPKTDMYSLSSPPSPIFKDDASKKTTKSEDSSLSADKSEEAKSSKKSLAADKGEESSKKSPAADTDKVTESLKKSTQKASQPKKEDTASANKEKKDVQAPSGSILPQAIEPSKYSWTNVAVGAICLGAGYLMMSLSNGEL